MRLKIVAVAAALISISTRLIDRGISVYLDELAAGNGVFGWLPQLETVGTTQLAYLYAQPVIVFGLSVIGVAALGYWAGSHLSLRTQYRPLLGCLALGGAAGQLLQIPLWTLITGGSLIPVGMGPAFSFVILLGAFVAAGLHFALVGLAGAALAEFGFDPVPRQDAGVEANTTAQLGPE